MVDVVFIHRFPSMASCRYRCEIPAREMVRRGHSASINGGDASVLVFSKPTQDDVELATAYKGKVKIVFDVVDNHLTSPVYQSMLKLADALVCPTIVMRDLVFAMTGLKASVIGDPYEMELHPPHAVGDRLIWFGHQVNLSAIRPYMTLPNLTVVTGPSRHQDTILWSQEKVRRELLAANIALFPEKAGGEHKSPNRLVNAMRMGCFAVCQPHPAYCEFKDFVWWGGKIKSGLRWAEGEDLNPLVEAGQQYIETRYSPAAIGDKWLDFLGSI